jgi:hypothetical protein
MLKEPAPLLTLSCIVLITAQTLGFYLCNGLTYFAISVFYKSSYEMHCLSYVTGILFYLSNGLTFFRTV